MSLQLEITDEQIVENTDVIPGILINGDKQLLLLPRTTLSYPVPQVKFPESVFNNIDMTLRGKPLLNYKKFHGKRWYYMTIDDGSQSPYYDDEAYQAKIDSIQFTTNNNIALELSFTETISLVYDEGDYEIDDQNVKTKHIEVKYKIILKYNYKKNNYVFHTIEIIKVSCNGYNQEGDLIKEYIKGNQLDLDVANYFLIGGHDLYMPIFYALSQLLNNPYLAEFEIQMKHIIKRQVQHTFDFVDFNPFEEPNPKILLPYPLE